MKIFTALLITCMLFSFSFAEGDEDLNLPKRDVDSVSKTLKALFDARLQDNREEEFAAKKDLADQIANLEKKNSIDNLLMYPDLWHRIREGTIDSSDRIFKQKGQGFRSGEFVDYTETTDRSYMYYLSLPKGYDPGGEQRFPVILFLHPRIEGRNPKIDRDTLKMLKDIYNDKALLEQYIIIAPVGPMERLNPRSKKKTLLDAGRNWEDLENGLKTAFIAIRIMLEQMVFDRARVYLDGVGEAGLTACRYATWYPSFFAGVVARDAPLAPLAHENVKGIPFLYVSSGKNKADLKAAAQGWAEQHGEGDPPQFTFLEDTATEEAAAGTSTKPSAQCITAVMDWMEKVKKETAPKEIYMKTADLQAAACYWLKIDSLNSSLNMELDDPDYPWVEGKIDTEANSVILKSNRVLGMTVFLNDKLVDMGKPVTIILNGKERFKGKLERSLDKMIDIAFYNLAGDLEIYCNYKEISEEEEK